MLKKISETLARIGVSANAVTFAGFLANVAAGAAAADGRWRMALLLALGGGGCDLVDGTLARLNPGRSKFGALWDSSLDRYGDALLIGGIGFYFARLGDLRVLAASLIAAAGAFQISYVRARAEGLGFACKVGFWERGERWVLLLTGLSVANPATAVVFLAFATHATAARRLIYIYGVSAGKTPIAGSGDPGAPPKWARPLNWLYAAVSIGCVVLLRWPVRPQIHA